MTTSPTTDPRPPLFVSADPGLLDELVRLAAAAGVTPDVARDPAAALRRYRTAPLVLVGADLTADLAALAPSRRTGVHVVAWGRAPDELYRSAVDLGAENVAEIPGAEAWVSEILADLGDPGAPRGVTVGVVGGSGGAGATTFACALGQVLAQRSRALVVDLDPLGPGLDRVLGLDATEGIRWDALLQTTGRLGARAFRDALPRRADLSVLTWHAGRTGALPAFAVREALSAGRRGHDTVVVDLPRSADALTDEVVARCDLLLVVVHATLTGVASAGRLLSRWSDRPDVRVVVRAGGGHGVDADDVAAVLGRPLAASVGVQRGLDEAIDLGLGPVRSRRGSLARAAAGLADRLSVSLAAA